MGTSLVQVRVEENLKKEVTQIYESFGIDLPTAIRIFFKKTVSVRGLPFDLKDSSTLETTERLEKFEQARNWIQEKAVPEFTLEEINAEIQAARMEKTDTRHG